MGTNPTKDRIDRLEADAEYNPDRKEGEETVEGIEAALNRLGK